jgi:hypothetical protein
MNQLNRRVSDLQLGKMMQSIEVLHQKMDEHTERTQHIDKRLNTLESDYTRYKGFFGGVVFVLSSLWAFMTFTWDRLRENLSRLFGGHG